MTLVLIRVIAFESGDPAILHGILVKGSGRDARPAATTCCGAAVYQQRRPAVRDGEPITCRPCLAAVAGNHLALEERDRV